MRRVGLLILPGAEAASAAAMLEAFQAAARLADQSYLPLVIGEAVQPVASSSGLRIVLEATIDRVQPSFEILIVASGIAADTLAPATRRWLQTATAQARLICGLDGGADLLLSVGPIGVASPRVPFSMKLLNWDALPAARHDAADVAWHGNILVARGVAGAMLASLELVGRELGEALADQLREALLGSL